MNNAKKVAINTIAMYVQLILNVLIGLVSVRIILNALGASDYGLYNLIAGIITMLSFVNRSLSHTSVRYISVSIGEAVKYNINKAFSSCLTLHGLIAICLVTILEFGGFFIFDGFLNIPKDRIDTAKVIYHCMVFSLFLNVLGSPFRAMLVAHERFLYLTFVGIFDAILKLVIALIITLDFLDKLAVYGLLLMLVTTINILMYVVMCQTKYKCDIHIVKCNKYDLKGVAGFAGWTLLDVIGSVATRQGYAVILNVFFGTIINAVFAIARQIEGHIYTISASVIDAMKPQIMKSQGAGDEKRMFRLSLTAGKFGFTMMAIVAIPLIVFMDDILKLWLKDVPDGTASFSSLLIIACMAEQITKGLVYANQAIGNIKWFSVSVSTMRFLALPISCLLFIAGASAIIAIYVFVICETLGSLSRILILSKISNFNPTSFISSVFFRIIPPFVLSIGICWLQSLIFSGISGICISSIISCSIYVILTYYIGLDKTERSSINRIVASLIKKIKL